MTDHPMQPVEWAGDVIWFRENSLVTLLLEQPNGLTLNDLALLPNVPPEDRRQLAQLIGYSVSGYCDLSYVDETSVQEADRLANELRDPSPPAVDAALSTRDLIALVNAKPVEERLNLVTMVLASIPVADRKSRREAARRALRYVRTFVDEER